MFCRNCGKELAEGAKFCPACGQRIGEAEQTTGSGQGGAPVQNRAAAGTGNMQRNEMQKVVYVKHVGFWSTGRLVLGIISILIFLFMTFQSCVVGTLNVLAETNDTGGTQGIMTGLCYLIAGIVGVASRNSLSKGGPMAAAIIYWLGAVCTIGGSAVYGDLAVWGVFAAILGFIFMLCAIKTTGELKTNEK